MTEISNEFTAYIDGFNLYKGALARFPEYKWLDLVRFCKDRMPGLELKEIYYFTAPVKERFSGDDAPRRQHTYLRVLRHQGIHVVEGKFRKDTKWLRASEPTRLGLVEPEIPSGGGVVDAAIEVSRNMALPDLPKAQVFDMEEKGSDVNLASFLLRDAFLGGTKNALIVTADSDLATPIRFATQAGCSTTVLLPGAALAVVELSASASRTLRIHNSWLASTQLPQPYVAPSGRHIHRPEQWGQPPLKQDTRLSPGS